MYQFLENKKLNNDKWFVQLNKLQTTSFKLQTF
jgi:hypothetical protein